MNFFPIFIPMGGGGGPPLKYTMLGGVIIVIGVAVGLVEYVALPSFHYDLQKTCLSMARIVYKCNMYPRNVTTVHHNTDCLVKKGYTMENMIYRRNVYNGETLMHISKPGFTSTQFMEDCKTCNTYSEIQYEHAPIWSGNKDYDLSKRLQWSSCRIRRDLM